MVGQIRPDRQTLLFSATMPRRIENLARDILTRPLRITVGNIGAANADITQRAHVLPNDPAKYPWLAANIQNFVDQGEVLVFANQKSTVE